MNFYKGQPVKIVSGKYAGKSAWFQSVSQKPGGQHCFVEFKSANVSMAQVKVSDLQAAK